MSLAYNNNNKNNSMQIFTTDAMSPRNAQQARHSHTLTHPKLQMVREDARREYSKSLHKSEKGQPKKEPRV